MSRWRLAMATGLAMGLLSGCVASADSPEDYRDKARETASAAASEVATARETAVLLADGRMFATSARVILLSSEQALDSISSSLLVVEPPVASDPVARQMSRLLAQAESQVRAARVAAQRSDEVTLNDAAARLELVDQRLRSLEVRL